MSLRWVVILIAVAAALSGCASKRAIPGLTTPTWAAATPAPLPRPPLQTVSARAGIPTLPVNPFDRYTLDAGDRVRVTVFGQDNLSRVYSVDSAGYIAMPLVGGVRAIGFGGHGGFLPEDGTGTIRRSSCGGMAMRRR